jgi:two-component system chemotaxis response regulator CheB
MPDKPTRVLLVDDSALALAVLQRMLATSSDIEVVGTASHGQRALELIPLLQPDLVCIDYHMPDLNGLELTQQVMSRFPRPILVVSSSVGVADPERVFTLLEAGAVDVFPKPRGGPDNHAIAAAQLVKKIKIVSGVRVHGRRPRATVGPTTPEKILISAQNQNRKIKMIAMGASTGGPQALQTILSHLPGNFPVPILCIQHISSGFLAGLVGWLGSHFQGRIQIAKPDETPMPGHVYFPQEHSHLIVDGNGRLQCVVSPPIGGHRPSITSTFQSVADHYKDAAIGVLLTGMGRDGSDGLRALSDAGSLTICQDEASSVIYGMPRDAIERGAARVVLPLNEIGPFLVQEVSRTASKSFGRR